MADAIREGRVRVNGVVAEAFGMEVDASRDTITVDGRPVRPTADEPVYLMLHKPDGILTTTSDDRGRKTVMDLLPAKYRGIGLHPVGRLDKDTTGLLILTNDGDLTQRLTHPKFEHPKEYLVTTVNPLSPQQQRQLERGIELTDGRSHPARIRAIRRTPPCRYSVVIHEGRKRQVRQMFEAVGHQVQALHRVRIGKLHLGDLREGAFRILRREEIL